MLNELTLVARTALGLLNTVPGASIAGSTIAVFLFRTLTKSSIEGMVKLNFDKQLQNYKSTLDSQLEKLKLSLKYADTFFSLEFEALTELRELNDRIIPKQYHRDMIWEDACGDIATSFEEHETELATFLAHYETVLPRHAVQKLKAALASASEGKFEVTHDSYFPPEATVKGMDLASEFVDCISQAIDALQKDVTQHVKPAVEE